VEPSLGKSSAKDFWHLRQCDWGHRFLPYPQLSFDDAQAMTAIHSSSLIDHLNLSLVTLNGIVFNHCHNFI